MAWKMRKDKLKAGAEDDAAAIEADAASPATAPAEAQTAPIFDLSGSAFQPPPAPTEEEPDLPQFMDDAPVAPTFAPDLATEPIAPGSAPDLSDELEPLPEFDPLAAPSVPGLEPDAIALAPPTPEAEVAEVPEATEVEADEPEAAPVPITPVVPETAAPEPIAYEEPEISPEREALAAGLVSTDAATGLPRVAPFILDTPPVAPAAPEAPRMHSVVIRIGRMSANYFLTRDVTTIGRPDSLVQNYPDIEIELDDGVSRRHAEIRDDGEGYTITDVGSTNGTLLNGAPLTPHQSVVLQEGDRIRVGERTELLFE